ncbi:helix-turn-helix domain-containing protein [Phascolarctobacterium sp.]|uniref:helix-turn-helix domain-containing protein n=1 Tax=Phascolarctobacterium sp. TaxID=2049039 RepID=UPI0030773FDF
MYDESSLSGVGVNIKMFRTLNHISQMELAKGLGISQTHMSNIEGGRVLVNLRLLMRMANIFQCRQPKKQCGSKALPRRLKASLTTGIGKAKGRWTMSKRDMRARRLLAAVLLAMSVQVWYAAPVWAAQPAATTTSANDAAAADATDKTENTDTDTEANNSENTDANGSETTEQVTVAPPAARTYSAASNDGGISTYGTETGNNTIYGNGADTSGEFVSAFGHKAYAIGNYSSAFGYYTLAEGEVSSAFGNEARAKALMSSAFGTKAYAAFDYSVAIGVQSTTTLNEQVSFGHKSGDLDINDNAYKTDLFRSLVNVKDLELNDTGAITGVKSINGADLKVGPDSMSGDGAKSMAFGVGANYTTASSTDAKHATAFGYNARAGADSSSAFGYTARATGIASSAFGNAAQALGMGSIAFGTGAKAMVDNSIAFGGGTTADASYSSAFGYNAKATNEYSSAIGAKSSTSADYQVSFGTWKVTDAETGAGEWSNLRSLDGIKNITLHTATDGTGGELNGVTSINGIGIDASRNLTNVGTINGVDLSSLGGSSVDLTDITTTIATKASAAVGAATTFSVDNATGNITTAGTINGVGITSTDTTKEIDLGGTWEWVENDAYVNGGVYSVTNEGSLTGITSINGITFFVDPYGEGGLGIGENVNGFGSTGIGIGLTNDGMFTAAVGYNGTVRGDYNSAFGAVSEVSGNTYGTAVGYESQIYNSERGTAVGANSRVGDYRDSSKYANYGTALGGQAQVYAANGTALGAASHVQAGHTNSVAIGVGSTTTAENQVNFGYYTLKDNGKADDTSAYQSRDLAGIKNIAMSGKITGVADGTADSDAVNFGQLKGKADAATTLGGLRYYRCLY